MASGAFTDSRSPNPLTIPTVRISLGALLVALLVLPCCSGEPERSEDAFCSTLRSEKERISNQLEEASAAAEHTEDGFAQALLGLSGSIQALGELRTYFNKLADVAPEEIREEAEIVAEQMDQQLDDAGDAASDPLGALASGLFNSIAISGQLEAMNNYALEHCGESI